MSTRNKLILFLVGLAIIDTIIPVPFTTLILIYVVMERPGWFRDYYREIYQE